MNVRRAKIQDSKDVSILMRQLGYKGSIGLIEKKIEEFSQVPTDEVFVAEESGSIIGVISCHITSLFHQEGSSGRITSLVIDNDYRGAGVGKALVSAAEMYFREMGCIKSEVTSGEHRDSAHAFSESCGYKQDERRFLKLYS